MRILIRPFLFLAFTLIVSLNTTFATGAAATAADKPAKRLLVPEDYYRLKNVGDPQVSPDGKWVAYTVASFDREGDKIVTTLWMVSWDGAQNVQLTHGEKSAGSPKWSPDGKYLSFTAAGKDGGKSQVWLMDRRGGEAWPLTNVKEDLDSYAWSPDGKRLLLTMSTDDAAQAAEKGAEGDGASAAAASKAAKPIVIDKYHFKQDFQGYLTAGGDSQLYLFDVETKQLQPLTTAKGFSDGHGVWSPDGKQIAFVREYEPEPGGKGMDDLFVVDAQAGAAARKVTSFQSAGGQRMVWSPDGRSLAYFVGMEPKFSAYNQSHLELVSAAGGASRDLTGKLDRIVSLPEFTPDGSAVTFLVEDDRRVYLQRMPLAGDGAVQKLTDGSYVLAETHTAGGNTALLASNDSAAPEVFAFENGKLRKLTGQNDAFLSEVQLGAVEDFSAKTKDGSEVHGLMTKPPFYDPAKKYPVLLWIHGGPGMQDDHALPFNLYPLQFERQMFATHGYVVLAVNYRGSTGRGEDYSKAIFADWGNKEVQDLLASVKYAIDSGAGDPERTGVGGWSYGGMLTDYSIASEPKFKAAISGAGIGNEISMYGEDEYIQQYNDEIGPPWKSLDTWLKISYPFFKGDKIKTPTLFVGGQADFNVPTIGGEQMYTVLRTQGVPTELVIYPEQFHIFTRPSYVVDRMHRYLTWWDKYLQLQKPAN